MRWVTVTAETREHLMSDLRTLSDGLTPTLTDEVDGSSGGRPEADLVANLARYPTTCSADNS